MPDNRPEYSKEGSTASGLRTLAIAGAIALASGTTRAIRLGDINSSFIPEGTLNFVNRGMEGVYATAERGFSATFQKLQQHGASAAFTRDKHLFKSGLLGEASDALSSLQSKPALRERLSDALSERYKSSGRAGEVTVGKLLDSVGEEFREGKSILYKTDIGLTLEAGQVKALKTLTEGSNPMLSRDLVVSPDLFFSKSANRAVESLNINTLDRALHGFKIPFVGNPFDFLTRAKAPVVARATAENMTRLLGQESSEGFFINGRMFADNGVGIEDVGKVQALRRGSSAERSFFMSDKKARAPRATQELFEEGFYDRSFLDKNARGLVENRFVEKLFGKKVGWSYRKEGLEEIAPILGEIEERLVNSTNPFITSLGLNKFGKRFSRSPETFGNMAGDFTRRTGKTDLYKIDTDAPAKPSFKDKFDNVTGGRAKGDNGYVSLTKQEYEDFALGGNRGVDMESLRRSRAKPVGADPDIHGYLKPNQEEVAQNIGKGYKAGSKVKPSHVFVPDDLATSGRITSNQLISTTVDLFEAFTGIGIAPGGAAQTVAAMVAASTAAFVAYEGMHFFDYLLESSNPFGNVGIEKSAIYSYSAARTAQQIAMLPLQAAGAPLEFAAPGLIDSPLGHGIRGFGALYLGNKVSKKLGKGGGLIGGAAAALFGMPDIYKDPGRVWDEHVGNVDIAIRKSRFWFMGPDDWRGGDVIGYRKSLLGSRLDDSQYDKYGGKGNYFLHGSSLSAPLRMAGGLINKAPLGESLTSMVSPLDPYYLEKRNYDDSPYPITGDMFADVPVVGPILGQTVGQIFKPQRLMHTDELQRYYSGADRGTDLQQIAMSLGVETVLPAERMARPRNFVDSVGETIDNTMDVFGMRGFLIASGKNMVTGDASFSGHPKTLRDTSELDSVASSLYDARLGGAFGLSELPRRFITSNSSLDEFNPIDGGYIKTSDVYGLERTQTGMIGEGGLAPGSGTTVDPLISWNTTPGKSTFRVPYLSTKLFGNKNPLEEYKHRVSVGTDFYDWNDPIGTIVDPYFRGVGEGDLLVSPFMSSVAVSQYARGSRSGAFLEAGAAAIELSHVVFGNESKGEVSRREVEYLSDMAEYNKIEDLKFTAMDKGDKTSLNKLRSMQQKTMAGLDYSLQGDAFAKNAYSALPTRDRRYLSDFINAPESERGNILEAVPGYMKDMLVHMWGQGNQNSKIQNHARLNRDSLAMKFRNGQGKDWDGWASGASVSNIKLNSAINGSGSLHSYGFWGADERDYAAVQSETYTDYDYAADAGADADEISALSQNFGLHSDSSSMISSLGGNTMEGNIMVDRSAYIGNIQNSRGGRF